MWGCGARVETHLVLLLRVVVVVRRRGYVQVRGGAERRRRAAVEAGLLVTLQHTTRPFTYTVTLPPPLSVYPVFTSKYLHSYDAHTTQILCEMHFSVYWHDKFKCLLVMLT